MERKMNMTPQTRITEQEIVEEQGPDEQFVRQVEDRSLPAQAVLTDQQQDRSANEADKAPVVFVP
jgi:hypothetical protein